MAYVLPKEISSSVKLTKNLYVFDLVFMAIMGLYFRSNSSINPKRRKYQSIYYALVRNRKAYIRE